MTYNYQPHFDFDIVEALQEQKGLVRCLSFRVNFLAYHKRPVKTFRALLNCIGIGIHLLAQYPTHNHKLNLTKILSAK